MLKFGDKKTVIKLAMNTPHIEGLDCSQCGYRVFSDDEGYEGDHVMCPKCGVKLISEHLYDCRLRTKKSYFKK